MNKSFKIFLIVLTCFVSSLYCFGLNVDLTTATPPGNRMSNTDGMTFSNGTTSDPTKLIGSTSAANTLNKIKWDAFNIGIGEKVKFVFNAAGQTILNYVPTTGNASVIQGNIQVQGNGNLMLVNPNGIYFNGANISNLDNTGTFTFSNKDLYGATTYDKITTSTKELQITPVYYSGIDVNNTKISNFDSITGIGTGIRITDNSQLTANTSVMFFTNGLLDFYYPFENQLYQQNTPHQYFGFVSPWYIQYNTDLPYSNSYASLLLDKTSKITVVNGGFQAYNYFSASSSSSPSSSIDIQGSIVTGPKGGILLSSQDIFGYSKAGINITGTLETSNNNRITIAGANKVTTYDYDIKYNTSPLMTDPKATQSTGNAITSDISNLRVGSYPYTDTQTGVNKVLRKYTISSSPPIEADFNYIYGPQPIPPPVVGSGSSNIATAIAVPTGTAAGVGVPSAFAAAPFLLAGLEPNSVVYAAAPIEGIKAPMGFLQCATEQQLNTSTYEAALSKIKTNGKFYLAQNNSEIINGTFDFHSFQIPKELQFAQRVRINVTMASQPYKEIDGQPELSFDIYKNITKADLNKKFETQQFLHHYLMQKYEVPMKITARNYANGLQKLSGELDLTKLQSRNETMQIAIKYTKNGFHKGQKNINPKTLNYAYIAEFERINP